MPPRVHATPGFLDAPLFPFPGAEPVRVGNRSGADTGQIASRQRVPPARAADNGSDARSGLTEAPHTPAAIARDRKAVLNTLSVADLSVTDRAARHRQASVRRRRRRVPLDAATMVRRRIIAARARRHLVLRQRPPRSFHHRIADSAGPAG